MEMRNINSAPKKANILFLYNEHTKDMWIGYWSEKNDAWLLYHELGPCEPGSMYRIVLEPTHWAELPKVSLV